MRKDKQPLKRPLKYKNSKVGGYVAFGVFLVLCVAFFRGLETGFEEY